MFTLYNWMVLYPFRYRYVVQCVASLQDKRRVKEMLEDAMDSKTRWPVDQRLWDAFAAHLGVGAQGESKLEEPNDTKPPEAV